MSIRISKPQSQPRPQSRPQSQPQLLLASASPRRRELLQQLGLDFTTFSPNIDETRASGEDIRQYAKRMAIEKAMAAYNAYTATTASAGVASVTSAENVADEDITDATIVVLGADTCGEIDDGHHIQLLHKPADFNDAQRLLRLLSNRQHTIYCAFALFDGSRLTAEVVTSTVTMGDIGDADIQQYWETGEPCDKAGAYAIQGLGAQFVKYLSGSYSAVMGLPLYELSSALATYHITIQ